MTLTVGCSFISGFLQPQSCQPLCNSLTHTSFPVRALSSKNYSGLASHGLTCRCHHSGRQSNLSVFTLSLKVNIYRYQRLIWSDTDMILVVFTSMSCYRPYRSCQFVCHGDDCHTGRTTFFQFGYPRSRLFCQQCCCPCAMNKQSSQVSVSTLAYSQQADFPS